MPRLALVVALLTLALGFALSSCRLGGGGNADETREDFAAQLEDDIADLAQAVEDLATSAGDLDDTRDESTECYATVGDCTVCYALVGGPLAGTFDAGLETEPCSAELTIRQTTATYTVDAFSLEGSWAATSLAGDYEIALVGDRGATLEVEGPRATTTYDSSWDLDLTASTEDFELADLELVLTYDGFDGPWEVNLVWDGATWTGTVTSPGGSSCTVSGTAASPSVSCDAG